MKLMTKQIEKQLEKYSLTGENDKGFDSEIVVKYFNPLSNQTWMFTEGQRVGNDWELYGYAEVFAGMPEWGYTMLSDIENVKLPMGLILERDLHIKKGTTVVQECERLGIDVPEYYYNEKRNQKFAKECLNCYVNSHDLIIFNEDGHKQKIDFQTFYEKQYKDMTTMRLVLSESQFNQWKKLNDFAELSMEEKYPEISHCSDAEMIMKSLNENELEILEYNLALFYQTSDISIDVDSLRTFSETDNERFCSRVPVWSEGMINTKDFIKEVFNKEIKIDENVLVGIYQLSPGDENFHKRFMGLDYLTKKNLKPNINDYELIHCTYRNQENDTEEGYKELCENLYIELNSQKHPDDYYGYSLSVGDVIVIGNEMGDIQTCMFCDNYGFKTISDFYDNDKKHAAFKFARQMDVNEELKMCDAVESGHYNDGFIPEFLLDNEMRKERLNDLKEYRDIIAYKKQSHLDDKIRNAETKKESHKKIMQKEKNKNEDRQI